jgi:plastocyanin
MIRFHLPPPIDKVPSGEEIVMKYKIVVLGSVCILLWGAQTFSAEPMYKSMPVNNGGVVTGIVRLDGKAPGGLGLAITKDEAVCRGKSPPARIAVNKDGCVQNAVVSIAGITRGKPFSAGRTVVLNQQQCEYEPHVLILSAVDHLEIVNSDPVLHNVHAYDQVRGLKTIFNIAQPIKGQRTPIKKISTTAPDVLLATCDAGHPWMSAYIIMADNPYYALTDVNGAYSIDKVPAGEYVVRLWHEGVSVIRTEMENGKPKKYTFEDPYILEQPVSVPAGGTTKVDFRLTLRPTSSK